MGSFCGLVNKWLNFICTVRRQPNGGVKPRLGFLAGELRYLAMLNFEIDPEALFPHVPPGTEIDMWRGKTFISVVGFLFLHARILGVPIFSHRCFEQVSLRFYVRRETEGGVRRGVAFIKQIVSKQATASIARLLYSKHFVTLPMTHKVDFSDLAERASGNIEYTWYHHGKWHGIHVEVKDDAGFPLPDSEEEFTIERYWGYSSQANGSCLEYRVEHPRWRVWLGSASAFTCDDASAYGPDLGACLIRTPSSALVAEGSPVTVCRVNPLVA